MELAHIPAEAAYRVTHPDQPQQKTSQRQSTAIQNYVMHPITEKQNSLAKDSLVNQISICFKSLKTGMFCFEVPGIFVMTFYAFCKIITNAKSWWHSIA